MNAFNYDRLKLAEPLMTPVARPSLALLFAAIIAEYLKDPEVEHPAIKDVEFRSESVVNAILTNGTVLAPAVKALNDLGIATPHTVGGIRHCLCGITKSELHDLACMCKGQTATNTAMATRWHTLATNKIG